MSEPYWIPVGGAPNPPAYGTTPPASPNDGDEWILPADAANGVMWRFRYRAASASAYKWEFVGGVPWLSLQGGVACANGSYTADPQMTFPVPRAGDYMIAHTGHANGAASWVVAASINNAAAQEPLFNILVPTGTYPNLTVGPWKVTVTGAGQTIRLLYLVNVAGLTTFRTYMTVYPVRVS